jgi:hypothetical protein
VKAAKITSALKAARGASGGASNISIEYLYGGENDSSLTVSDIYCLLSCHFLSYSYYQVFHLSEKEQQVLWSGLCSPRSSA